MLVMLPWKFHCLLVVPAFDYHCCVLMTLAALNCAGVPAKGHEIWLTRKVLLEPVSSGSWSIHVSVLNPGSLRAL